MNRTAINQKANREIKKQIEKLKICYCEVCGHPSVWLTIAHRHKRDWYKDKSDELLWNYKQWIVACIKDHEKLEKDKKLTEKIFLKLRGEDNPDYHDNEEANRIADLGFAAIKEAEGK